MADWRYAWMALGLMASGPAMAAQQPELGARTAPRLSVDGLAFKDLNRNGKLDPYEDWRLSARRGRRTSLGA